MTPGKSSLKKPFLVWGLLSACLLVTCLIAMPAAGQQNEPADLPLLQPDAFIYEGAFRLPADEFGVSSLNYSEGPIALNPENESLFIVGHSHHQAIAEFKIPTLVRSDRLEDLNRADAPLQPFYGLLDRTVNDQALDRIGGMLLLDTSGGKSLMVNAYEYYDAPGDNTHTSLIVEDAARLGVSAVEGFYTFEGGAGHTSGWMSPIPADWQPMLGGTHLTGQSSGIPIISRTSVGPSAFSFTPSTLANASQMIETTRLLDFSLEQPLHADLENTTASNKLWTHLSRAVYGVIIPGSRTYVTVGYSGGHESGVCYKCTQNNGNVCGGYCAPDAADYGAYYWLWDVNDLVEVKEGRLSSDAVRPYAYGELGVPFEGSEPQIGGGAFDPETGLLYLTLQKADTQAGDFANPPVVVAYRFALNEQPVANEEAIKVPTGVRLDGPYPNPAINRSVFEIQVDRTQAVHVALYDVLGRNRVDLFDGMLAGGVRHVVNISRNNFPAGLYMIRVQAADGVFLRGLVLE